MLNVKQDVNKFFVKRWQIISQANKVTIHFDKKFLFLEDEILYILSPDT
jgi:hypothetical protein